jgi:hypothetical protein
LYVVEDGSYAVLEDGGEDESDPAARRRTRWRMDRWRMGAKMLEDGARSSDRCTRWRMAARMCWIVQRVAVRVWVAM